MQTKIVLGNLNAKRDWGHAKDFVLAQWLIMQQKKPKDYVIATGKQYSVKQFVNEAAAQLKIRIKWRGKGLNEKGYDQNGKIIIECSKKYFRPAEVETLLGRAKLAQKDLKWKPKINFKRLVKEMVEADYLNLLKERR